MVIRNSVNSIEMGQSNGGKIKKNVLLWGLPHPKEQVQIVFFSNQFNYDSLIIVDLLKINLTLPDYWLTKEKKSKFSKCGYFCLFELF